MTTTPEEHARLRVDIGAAARLVAPLWPIERFIAVNPLMGLLDLGFERATEEAACWLGTRGHPDPSMLRRAHDRGLVEDQDLADALRDHGLDPEGGAGLLAASDPTPPPVRARTVLETTDAEAGSDLARRVDAEVARWCALLVGEHPLPAAPAGPYAAWRRLAPRDRRLAKLAGCRKAAFRDLPEDPATAVLAALEALGVPGSARTDELRGQFARLPGWAGYARWCDEWAEPSDPAPRLRLVELLAIGLTLDAAALGACAPTATVAPTAPRSRPAGPDGSAVVLSAMEGAFRRRLVDRLASPAAGPAGTPAAQAVFCIDVRSEGLRRHLEAAGPYETFGFAGFFAVPLRFRGLGWSEAHPSAPVLLQPATEVDEVALPGFEGEAQRALRADRRRADGRSTAEATAHGPLSMFALAEAAGWILGPRALARTLRPTCPASTPGARTRLAVGNGAEEGFSLAERVLIAETALRTMGLTEGFAPVVLLCGHRSTTTANPHGASLDCGACGGNPGGDNARAAAAILNDPAVRAELATGGIEVPSSTLFVAGEHDTTTDRVVVLDPDQVPPEHRARVEALAADLVVAGQAQAADRLRALPGGDAGRARHQVGARAGDWAQTRPEWGLAGNAAFIVAPRARTRGLDLDGRAFLHSYDPQGDADGTALETILTAPMVVAHWINAQYFASTVDPEVHGAGDKTLHNPLPGVGVLTGSAGDLRTGLPLQSVMDGDRPYHEPLRLLTVVEAPRDRLVAVIERNPVLQQLFDGSWVHLVAVDPTTGAWHRRRAGGAWETVEPHSPSTTPTRPEEILT